MRVFVDLFVKMHAWFLLDVLALLVGSVCWKVSTKNILFDFDILSFIVQVPNQPVDSSHQQRWRAVECSRWDHAQCWWKFLWNFSVLTKISSFIYVFSQPLILTSWYICLQRGLRSSSIGRDAMCAAFVFKLVITADALLFALANLIIGHGWVIMFVANWSYVAR